MKTGLSAYQGWKNPLHTGNRKVDIPVKLIDEWIQTSAQDGFQQARKRVNQIEGALLAAGSNDPILDILLTAIKKDHPAFNIFSANTGSISGLEALNTGLTELLFLISLIRRPVIIICLI